MSAFTNFLGLLFKILPTSEMAEEVFVIHRMALDPFRALILHTENFCPHVDSFCGFAQHVGCVDSVSLYAPQLGTFGE